MMINFSPTYTPLDSSPTYTQFDSSLILTQFAFLPTKTAIAFTPINTLIAFPQSVELIFDDLNIPEFLSDETAIATLAPLQAYQLIGSRVVKVTPPDLFTNIWANFSKAFSYIRRAF